MYIYVCMYLSMYIYIVHVHIYIHMKKSLYTYKGVVSRHTHKEFMSHIR